MKQRILQKIKHTKISVIAALILIPTVILFHVLEYFTSYDVFWNLLIANTIGVSAVAICLILKEKETK